MDRQRTLRVLLIIAFVSFVGMGAAANLIGTGWPTIQDEFARPIEDLGLLVAVGIAATGITAAASGSCGRVVGTDGLLIGAFVLFAASSFVFVLATSWMAVVVAAALGGIGHGMMDPSVNAHIAKHHGTRMMNLLHASFGLGAVIGPLLMAWSLQQTDGWRWAFGVIGMFGALLLIVILVTRAGWQQTVSSVPDSRGPRPTLVRLAPFLLTFFLAVGLEISTGQWAFSILDERGIGVEVAAGFVASFWAGLTIGRLSGVLTGDAVSRRTTLMGSAGLLAVGLAWLWADPGGRGAWGLPIAGLGMALVFPTMVSLTADRFGSEADLVIGWEFAAASAGGAMVPWIVGIIGSRLTLEIIPPLLLGGVVGLWLAAMVAASRQAEGLKPPAPATP